MIDNPYEQDAILAEYLLFHYGDAAMTAAHPAVEAGLYYPVRCVTETFSLENAKGRALDLGCAVGRSSFELARVFKTVVGIDYSFKFVDTATRLKVTGSVEFRRKEEGPIYTTVEARVPADIDRSRVDFRQGDAMALPDNLGKFEAVLLANLIDRLSDPTYCLAEMRNLVVPGGELVVTSPYTWMEEYALPDNWLSKHGQKAIDGLRQILEPEFSLEKTLDLPFLIREHARKFQWSVAQATVWKRSRSFL